MNIIWKESGVAISGPVSFGGLHALETSVTNTITVQTDSPFLINQVGLYISPFTPPYIGGAYANKDYDQLIWYGDNYPGSGLQINQTYFATGQVGDYDGVRIIDLDRTETVDIFSGQTMEILDGLAIGETTLITAYDPVHNFFTIATPFSFNVVGANYSISVAKSDFVHTHNGSSLQYPIPLLNAGGIILPNEIVSFDLIVTMPRFLKSAANLYVDLNLSYTPTELYS